MKNKTVLRKVIGAYRCTQFDGNVSHLQTWLNQWAEEKDTRWKLTTTS